MSWLQNTFRGLLFKNVAFNLTIHHKKSSVNLWFKAFQFSIKLINTTIILLRLFLFPSHINLAELHCRKCCLMTFRSYAGTAAGINSNLNFREFCFKNKCIAYNADSCARLERRNFNVPGEEFFLNKVNPFQ